MLSLLFGVYSVYNFILESKRYKLAFSEIDHKFVSENNKMILYAVDEIKKYILKHPELKKYFKEDKSLFENINYLQYRNNLLGSAYVHEEKLSNKRWDIAIRVNTLENENTGKINCIVLFNSPTNFVIEYLRFDLEIPYIKKFTIIDGRINMKDWVEEMDPEKVDKRAYPRYREEDNIKY